ncbi:MAG: electron transporter RnfD [Ignavibacteriae bacterium]|nr:electron transporter RnfD [Ignavibacteriota bacterium]
MVNLVWSCSPEESLWISSINPQIEYMGRIGEINIDTTKELYWSGTSIKISFEGKFLNAIFEDENGDNFYNIIVDDDEPYILQLDSNKKSYNLCELEFGKHTVEIFKRTEWDRGKTIFFGFQIDKKGSLLPKSAKKRKIEFYGNSITAGYAVDDYEGKDRSEGVYTNNYLSYAAITARHYDAEYVATVKSGIGIMVSWFPVTMPEIFDRINPNDSLSLWDFSKYQPGIVVINLFQNDSWIVNMPENESFKLKFGDEKPDEQFIINSYKKFVYEIRNKYPSSNIICMLGNMDITKEGSPWPGYVKQAVMQLNDDKVYTFVVPYKNTPGHPDVKEQEEMVNSLIEFIDKNIIW